MFLIREVLFLYKRVQKRVEKYSIILQRIKTVFIPFKTNLTNLFLSDPFQAIYYN